MGGGTEWLRGTFTARRVWRMAAASSTAEKSAGKRSRQAADNEPASRLRAVRLQRGFTQTELARLAGMHRNSIRNLENGKTQEVTSDTADALAAVLKTSVEKLGLPPVRPGGKARAIRIRSLSAEQRQIVDELLSLPPEDYALIRGAIETLRRKRSTRKKRRRGARR